MRFPAARLTKVGNKVIVMAFVYAGAEEIKAHRSRVIIADERNRREVMAPMMAEPLAPFGGMGSCLGEFGHG